MKRCLFGIIPNDRTPRCKRPAADGFDYCPAHGERLGLLLLQCAGEREAILGEHRERQQACGRKQARRATT